MIDNNGEDAILIINATIPGKKDTNVKGANALCDSLKVFEPLAIEIHNPLINIEYVIIMNMAMIILWALYIIFIPSYIENISCATINEIIVKIKLIIPVIIEDIDTPKNFPSIISLLFIGNVNNVSSVPLSFSPAVVSVDGYVAETVIAMTINKNA